jgi:hypothetical protein
MTGTMLISIAGLSGYARVRRIAVSLPLIPSLLEAPTRFYLPGQADPAAPVDPPAVVKHRTYERERRRRGQSATTIARLWEETGHDREVLRAELRKRLRRAGIGRRHHIDDELERQIARIAD